MPHTPQEPTPRSKSQVMSLLGVRDGPVPRIFGGPSNPLLATASQRRRPLHPKSAHDPDILSHHEQEDPLGGSMYRNAFPAHAPMQRESPNKRWRSMSKQADKVLPPHTNVAAGGKLQWKSVFRKVWVGNWGFDDWGLMIGDLLGVSKQVAIRNTCVVRVSGAWVHRCMQLSRAVIQGCPSGIRYFFVFLAHDFRIAGLLCVSFGTIHSENGSGGQATLGVNQQ